MKKVISTIICLSFFSLVHADLGSCVVYSAKFYMKNGEIFNGHFECRGDGQEATVDNKYCNDEGLFKLIQKLTNSYQKPYDYIRSCKGEYPDRLLVFKKLNMVRPKHIRGLNNDSCYEYYGLALSEDIVYLRVSDIEKVVFWDVQYSGRNWLTSDIILGDETMLELVSKNKYWNDITVELDNLPHSLQIHEGFTEAMWGYRMINYNEKINIPELKRLVNIKLLQLDDPKILAQLTKALYVKLTQNMITYEEYQRRSARIIADHRCSIMNWFLKKKILVVRVNGTC